MKTIEAVLDTNIIMDNTRDGMRVNIKTDESIAEYISPDGTLVKGTGLTKTLTKPTSITAIKSRLQSLPVQIAKLQEELDELTLDLPLVEIAVDTKIDDAILNGAEDQRVK